jgi:hypothetical protein
VTAESMPPDTRMTALRVVGPDIVGFQREYGQSPAGKR